MVLALAGEGDGRANGAVDGIEGPDGKGEDEFRVDGGEAADVFFKDKASAAEEGFGADQAERLKVGAEDGEIGGAVGGDNVVHVTEIANKGRARAGGGFASDGEEDLVGESFQGAANG